MSALNFAFLHLATSEDNELVSAAFGVAALIATTVIYYSLTSGDKEDGFYKLPGIQLFHAWDFFKRRHDFPEPHSKQNPGQWLFSMCSTTKSSL